MIADQDCPPLKIGTPSNLQRLTKYLFQKLHEESLQICSFVSMILNIPSDENHCYKAKHAFHSAFEFFM
jgi:hypothetical protein